MLWKLTYPRKSTFLPCKYVKMPFLIVYSLHTTDGNLSGCLCPGSTLHQDITSLNKLITAYSKAGDLVYAQKMFDHMLQRDVVSWNSIMSGYAEHEQYDKVQQTFVQMRNHGLIPNHTSFATVLSACGKLRALTQGTKIHGLSVKTCSSSNVFVGTSLITMYSKCGVYDCLIRFFKDIDCPNIASCNALISGFVLNLQIDDARQVFDMMHVRNVVSWTAMIHGYIEIKKVNIALDLFNLMPIKNSVTWSVMVGGLANNGMYEEAIKLFTTMIWHNIKSTVASIINVIGASCGLKNVKQGRKFHGHVIKVGYHHYESIEASLISMYCQCLNIEESILEFRKMENKFVGSCNSLLHGLISNGEIDQARMFFDVMEERDQISWNLMINGYLKNERRDAAFDLYSKMHEPTVETTTALMMSFIQDGLLHKAQELFDMMPEVDVIAYTTLISGYLEYGLLHKAMTLFRKMPERNVVTYNVMISGLLKHGKVSEAYSMFNKCPKQDNSTWDALITGFVQNGLLVEAFLHYKKMLLSGIIPSELVMATLLSASSRLSVLIHGLQIHPVAIKLGHESHMVVENSLLSMYCRFGDVLSAKLIFERMTKQDVVTWNTMIYGYAFNGFGEHAIRMFEDMRITNIKPDHVTFIGLLSACSHMCLFEKAEYYFHLMSREYGITPDLTHYSCVIDLLCRMGMVEQAERLTSSMPFEPDSKIWTSLLSGCRLTCNIRIAKHAANELLTWDPRNPMPFLHLINVYASSGRWGDIEILRKQMDDRWSKKIKGCSWI
ncbi:Pentatricopeptide repeat-containing protein [Canna indica]|uniref:Pentatricopeptide repeat-containing protein n=1 Tax=Canna indica TaxID=4628 RepID=A0AAQ3K776_9LILI|nr:Pentatricopeptide repeat-containing protein [Canna indica]